MKKGLKIEQNRKEQTKVSERKLGICKENKTDLTYTYQTTEQMKQKKKFKDNRKAFLK